jgi:putative addiction module killer protein
LQTQAAAEVATAIVRLELGHASRVKGIGTIAEYRIDWGPGYRSYFGREGDALIILLGGGTKQRQQLDIERAKAWWAECKARKAVEARPKGKR